MIIFNNVTIVFISILRNINDNIMVSSRSRCLSVFSHLSVVIASGLRNFFRRSSEISGPGRKCRKFAEFSLQADRQAFDSFRPVGRFSRRRFTFRQIVAWYMTPRREYFGKNPGARHCPENVRKGSLWIDIRSPSPWTKCRPD